MNIEEALQRRLSGNRRLYDELTTALFTPATPNDALVAIFKGMVSHTNTVARLHAGVLAALVLRRLHIHGML